MSVCLSVCLYRIFFLPACLDQSRTDDCVKVRTEVSLSVCEHQKRMLHVFVDSNQSFNQGPVQSINQSPNWTIDQAIGLGSVPVIEARGVAHIICRLRQQWSSQFGRIVADELSSADLCLIVYFVKWFSLLT